MKKLNRLKVYTIIMLASTLFTACNVLEVEPEIIIPDNFYSSEKAVLYGLAGIYGVLNNEEVYGRVYSVILSGADDLTYQNRGRSAGVPWYTHSTSDKEVYDTWKWLYAGIKNANEFIPAVTGTEYDKNGLYVAEARFLRAYYHFLLAQAWGDIPLRSEKITSPNNTQLQASPQADVLTWCTNEMETAWKVFDDYYASEEGAAENVMRNAPSRISKHTIEGILARVYLFMAGKSVKDLDSKQMYAKVIEWAGQAIDSSMIKLNPNYSQVFINMIQDKYDEQYYESMWEAEFIGNRETAQLWSNGRIGDVIGLQSTASDNKYGEWSCNFSHALYNGSLKLWDLYATEDRTSDDLTDTVRDARQLWNLPPYNYKGNTSGINGIKYSPSYDKTPYTVRSDDGKKTLTSFLMVADNSGTMEMIEQGVAVVNRNIGKWRRETEYEKQMTAKTLNTSINFPILRYADILLMYAEAVNEYNGVPNEKAYECLEKVRDRAQIETPAFSTINNYQAFQDIIRNERGRELAFEAIRKYDLIRWGIFTEAMRDYKDYASRPENKNNTEFGRGIETSKNIQEKHIYLPTPMTELSVNKLLNQNQLW